MSAEKNFQSRVLTPWFMTALLAVIGLTVGSIPARASGRASLRWNALVAQEDEPASDDSDVPPQDVDKYIKVYKAMQENRNLTVEQAAGQQGLTVTAFRSLEDRIERNDALREHVRDSLKPKGAPSATP